MNNTKQDKGEKKGKTKYEAVQRFAKYKLGRRVWAICPTLINYHLGLSGYYLSRGVVSQVNVNLKWDSETLVVKASYVLRYTNSGAYFEAPENFIFNSKEKAIKYQNELLDKQEEECLKKIKQYRDTYYRKTDDEK